MIPKKTVLIAGFIVLLLSSLLSYAYFSFASGGKGGGLSFTNYALPDQTNGGTESPSEPKTEECPLNGEMLGQSLKAKWEGRRPMGIMVENSLDARPQSGLSSADIIYEAVAEGGITRFLAIYYCHDASFIGPVRSARIYFIKLLQGYGNYPLYAHVGGANTDGPADALGEIEELGWANYNDLNQFSVPFPNFWRDYERLPNRATEHTVYTSSAKLWEYAKTKRKLSNVDEDGVPWNKDFQPWKFKSDAAQDARGATSRISFNFWDTTAANYGVVWKYDRASNSYVRENGGKAHLDKNTGKPLTTKNVVVLLADESVANDGYEGGQHLLYDIVGTGEGVLFQDGKAVKIAWDKAEEESGFVFTDSGGKEVSFNRGQIFVEILPTGNTVTY